MIKTQTKTSINTQKALLILGLVLFAVVAGIYFFWQTNNESALAGFGKDKGSYKVPDPLGLSVHPDNFRYFVYQNKPLVMATYGAAFGVAEIHNWVGDKNPATQDCYLDLMAAHHLNHFYHIVDLRLKPGGQPYPNSPFGSRLDFNIGYFSQNEQSRHLKSITSTKCYDLGRQKFCANPQVDFLLLQNKGAPKEMLIFGKPVVLGGPWAKQQVDEPQFMRQAVLLGLNPSTNLYSSPPGETTGFDYAAELYDFFLTVDTWADEPGGEINENSLP